MPSARCCVHYCTASGLRLAKLSVSLGFDCRSRIGTIGGMIMALQNDRGRKLISCREAAEAYGCTMSYIRRLARLGRLEHEEVGGTYVFDEAEVKRLAAQAAKAEGRQRKRAVRFKPG